MLCDGIHPVFDVSPIGKLGISNQQSATYNFNMTFASKYIIIGDALDMRLPNASPISEIRSHIQAQAETLLSKHHCVFIGGDHSVTLALLRAMKKKYPDTPLAMIHFDAHCDTWKDHFGEPSGHGTWTYEAIEEGLVSAEHTIQIGIRSSGERSAREYVQDKGGKIFTAKDIRGLDGASLSPVLGQIRERIGSLPVYLTLDIDCLDPAFAPGTGTPEPGGMTSSQVLTFLEDLACDLNFVGMDCVEVAPAYDHADLTSNAAATFIWTYLCGQVKRIELAS
jgi:agmatinase